MELYGILMWWYLHEFIYALKLIKLYTHQKVNYTVFYFFKL